MRRRTMKKRHTALSERGAARTWLVAIVLLLCLCVLCFLRVGNWLVREDPLKPSTAIAVLSGAMPERALEAAEIYHAGLAPEVWLTQPAEPKQTMATLGIPFDGEEEYSRRILLKHGVPERAIRILQPTIVNTADEVGVIAATLQRGHGLSVIVVTSKAHTRRVHGLWSRLAAGRGQIIVRAARTDSFDPSHWWRTTHDALDVVREVLGLLNVWAGLPLKSTK
jgi:uncharacterized SAM-binding protein YcdF (DUF218 family)